MISDEIEIIRAFVVSSRRDRLLELLAKPKRRRDVTTTLAHFRHLDPRWVVDLRPSEQDREGIQRALRSRGAPDACYLISENRELDGQRLQLAEALDRIIGAGMGTLVSCIPGVLAFFEGEGPSDRCILERRAI